MNQAQDPVGFAQCQDAGRIPGAATANDRWMLPPKCECRMIRGATGSRYSAVPPAPEQWDERGCPIHDEDWLENSFVMPDGEPA